MKIKTYMRVAQTAERGQPMVQAGVRPSAHPLKDSFGEPLPTAHFAIDLIVPDELFAAGGPLRGTIDVEADDVRVTGSQVPE